MLVACAFHVEYTFSYRFLATSALKEIDQPRGPSLPYGTLFKFHFRRKHAILQFAAWGLTVIAVTVITATFIAVTFIAVAFVAVTFIAGDFHCTDFQRSVTRKYRLLNFLWLYKLYIYILYRMVWALLEKTPAKLPVLCISVYPIVDMASLRSVGSFARGTPIHHLYPKSLWIPDGLSECLLLG